MKGFIKREFYINLLPSYSEAEECKRQAAFMCDCLECFHWMKLNAYKSLFYFLRSFSK